jgi:hypothetical protein
MNSSRKRTSEVCVVQLTFGYGSQTSSQKYTRNLTSEFMPRPVKSGETNLKLLHSIPRSFIASKYYIVWARSCDRERLRAGLVRPWERDRSISRHGMYSHTVPRAPRPYAERAQARMRQVSMLNNGKYLHAHCQQQRAQLQCSCPDILLLKNLSIM